jgi:MerR family copper efflux transcriptional regulator
VGSSGRRCGPALTAFVDFSLCAIAHALASGLVALGRRWIRREVVVLDDIEARARRLVLELLGHCLGRPNGGAVAGCPRRATLDLSPRGRVYGVAVGRDGLLIGEVAKQGGTSRKALRLYEAAGILAPPRRTASGYRVYGADTLELLAFVRQAQRLGFTLAEIKQIVSIKRSGRAPRPHVRELVRRKVADLDRTLADLGEVRDALRGLLGWRDDGRRIPAAVCACIEAAGPKHGATTNKA